MKRMNEESVVKKIYDTSVDGTRNRRPGNPGPACLTRSMNVDELCARTEECGTLSCLPTPVKKQCDGRMKNKGYDLQGYARVNNGKYSDESGDDDIDLPIRKVYKPQHFIEVQIQDGDTLQAIALRFNCTVSTIMRANNILRENEIFAKRVLKIPVTAFSLLTESLPLVHTSGTNSPTRANEAKQIKDNSEIVPLASDNDFQQKLIVASVNASQINHTKYSGTLSEDNVRAKTSKDDNIISASNIPIGEQNNVHLEELTSPMLRDQRSPKSVENVLIREFTSKGADFGIKWMHLLVCILLLCFLIPLVYVIHIAEHPEKYHLDDHH